MKLKRVILLSIILCIITFTGCWDSKDLDELLIPFLISYDLAEPKDREYPDDRYLVGASYPSFYEGEENKDKVAVAVGYMIGETRSRRNADIGEELVTGQVKVLLIGSKLAEAGDLNKAMDILIRNPSTKASMYLAIVAGKALDILESKVNNYPNTHEYLTHILKNINKTNFYPDISLFDYNRAVVNNDIVPLIPNIIYKEGDVVLGGSCYINEGKTLAYLGREETETAVMLRGTKCSGSLSFPVKEGDQVIDGISVFCTNQRKVKIKNEKDYYSIDIAIKLTGSIIEHA